MKELGTDPCCLLENYSLAYEKLPECYKSDHSLRFFIDAHGNLCAEHTLHSEEYLWSVTQGDWLRVR